MRYFNNFDALMKLILSMMGGFGNTLLIFCFTLIFSLPLGLALALLRMSKRRIISAPISLYILVMRGTPLMLQIFAIYFAIPTLTGVNLDRMNATILSLVEENRPVEAAAQMETYLNLAERTMLKALERASDPA